MKILYVTNEVPHFTGGGMVIRDFHLVKNIGTRHHVTVVCFAERLREETERRAELLRQHCDAVFTVPRQPTTGGRWRSRMTTLRRLVHPIPWNVRDLTPAALRKLVATAVDRHGPYDILHVNHVEMAPLFLHAGRARRVIGIEVVTPKLKRLLAVQRGSVHRMAQRVEMAKFAFYERAVYARADLCAMASEVERQNVLAMSPDARVTVIPNGVDRAYLSRPAADTGQTGTLSLLFLGALSYVPNDDAVQFFHREVWPLIRSQVPGLRWQIVGRDPSAEIAALASHDIEVTGWVNDARPYLWASTVMVVPLRSGSGTRLKILEAMAAGIPVVSTSIGAEGLAVMGGQDILIADTPQEFAAAVVSLLQQPALAKRLAARGLELVESLYDWGLIANRLDQAYLDLFSENGTECLESA